MGVVAVLQLILGPTHPINRIHEGLGADHRHGIGSYTVGNVGIEWLFRPTSIFLHTGKFGQIAFILATYCLFFRAGMGPKALKTDARMLIELNVLLITGQRAAILGYVAALLLLHASPKTWVHLGLRALSLCAIGMGALSVLRGVNVGTVAQLVGRRVWSGVTEIPSRFQRNLLEPLDVVVERFGSTGAGAGAFSLGSTQWGGMPLYDVIDVGTAENSWLRILAELGWFGVLLFGAGIVALIWVGGRELMRRRDGLEGEELLRRHLLKLSVYQLVIVALWANTHDVLGSATTMAILFGYAGILLAGRRPKITESMQQSGAGLILGALRGG